MAFSGDKGTVIIIGRVIAEMQPGLSLYAASYTKSGDEDEVYAAISSRHKLKKVKEEKELISTTPNPSPQAEGKTKRKKKSTTS